MKLKLKPTLIGIGLTAGLTFMLHDKFESQANDRENSYAALINCAKDLGQIGCPSIVENAGVKPETVTTSDNSVIYTYSPDRITDKANDIRSNDERGFQYFVYPTSIIVGLGLTAAMQNRSQVLSGS